MNILGGQNTESVYEDIIIKLMKALKITVLSLRWKTWQGRTAVSPTIADTINSVWPKDGSWWGPLSQSSFTHHWEADSKPLLYPEKNWEIKIYKMIRMQDVLFIYKTNMRENMCVFI